MVLEFFGNPGTDVQGLYLCFLTLCWPVIASAQITEDHRVCERATSKAGSGEAT
jgi:hypothetical protein